MFLTPRRQGAEKTVKVNSQNFASLRLGVNKSLFISRGTDHGFTLIELIMVIVILGVLSVTVAIKWPTGMQEDAARIDFRHAVRYAQHKAMTRQYTGAATSWKIIVAANRYTIGREGTDCSSCPTDPNCAESDYCNRALPDNTTISNGEIHFNGLGEPIDTTGSLLGDTTFTVGTGQVKICAETGYVE